MPSRFEAAVELRLREKRAGQAQGFVGATQFLDFPLKRLDPFLLSGGGAGTLARIAFVLTYPASQRLGRAADLAGDGDDRRPLGFILFPALKDHTFCTVH